MDILTKHFGLKPMIRIPLCLTAICLMSAAAAQEVSIGHLETNNDTGINWLFFHCNKIANGAQMACDIFQTYIMKAKTEAQVNYEIKQHEGVDALAEFNANFRSDCPNIIENVPKMEAGIDKGVDLFGKPINLRVVRAGISAAKEILEVCRHPTQESARQLFVDLTKRQAHTCKVHNSYSKSTFTFNPQTNSWISQDGPTGPCGTIQIGSLTQDPKNRFWSYVEKTLRTNFNGVLPNGQSCKMYPEHTMNYSWHTTTTAEGCDLIESYPD